MKKHIFTVCLVLFALLPLAGAFAQEGYTGPGSDPATRTQGALSTVAEAKNLRDDARVTLQGTIANQISREKFTFRDTSGEIVVEIDRKLWRGFTAGPNDRVEIYGEVDVERRGTQVEIDVKSIRKL